MKFFVVIATLVAVAVAMPHKPAFSQQAELEAIVAAIQSPSTDPGTAALLEQQLEAILGGASPIAVGPAIIDQSPISIGPAIIDQSPISIGPAIIDQSPISIGPAIIDFPLPDGGAVSAPVAPVFPSPVVPSPVVVGPIAPGQPAPLVQLIVNVNQAPFNPIPVGVGPVAEPSHPVIVVDQAVNAPVAPEAPVQVDPVQVVDVSPIVVEPVLVGTPIIPSPAVNLPEELN